MKNISQQATSSSASPFGNFAQSPPSQTESHSSPIRRHPADGEKISLFRATSRLCLDPQLHCALSNSITRLGSVRLACSSEFILLLKTVADPPLVQVCHAAGHSAVFYLLPFLSAYQVAGGHFSTATAPPGLWPFLFFFFFFLAIFTL